MLPRVGKNPATKTLIAKDIRIKHFQFLRKWDGLPGRQHSLQKLISASIISASIIFDTIKSKCHHVFHICDLRFIYICFRAHFPICLVYIIHLYNDICHVWIFAPKGNFKGRSKLWYQNEKYFTHASLSTNLGHVQVAEGGDGRWLVRKKSSHCRVPSRPRDSRPLFPRDVWS